MEATCRAIVWRLLDDEGPPFVRTRAVCGAPIPRLDEGPCETCGWMHHVHVQWPPIGVHPCDLYLGPLASECTNGHPVAVQTEAERRG